MDSFLEKLRRAEKDAYAELIRQFSDIIFNVALGLLQNREDAEDVTQEVFAEVFRSIGRFREESKLSTWIYQIAVSKSLELIRSRKRSKRFGSLVSLFGREDHFNLSADEPFYHPGVSLENKEMSAILFNAIRRLPLNQRTAFTLNKLEHLSYAEIAEAMNVSLSSVESLMFRAKKNLQELLGRYYEENVK